VAESTGDTPISAVSARFGHFIGLLKSRESGNSVESSVGEISADFHDCTDCLCPVNHTRAFTFKCSGLVIVSSERFFAEALTQYGDAVIEIPKILGSSAQGLCDRQEAITEFVTGEDEGYGLSAGVASNDRAVGNGPMTAVCCLVLLSGEAEPGEIVRARIERASTYDLHGRITGAVAHL